MSARPQHVKFIDLDQAFTNALAMEREAWLKDANAQRRFIAKIAKNLGVKPSAAKRAYRKVLRNQAELISYLEYRHAEEFENALEEQITEAINAK
jgi:gluconate kinase